MININISGNQPEKEDKKLGKNVKFDHMKLIGQYAGGHKKLITLGRFLAGISAVMTLIPYYDLWKIISIAVNGEDLERINGYAWRR